MEVENQGGRGGAECGQCIETGLLRRVPTRKLTDARERRIEEGSPADERREVDGTAGQKEPALTGFGVSEVREECRRFRADLLGVGVQRRCGALTFGGGAEYQHEHEDERSRPPNDRRPADA